MLLKHIIETVAGGGNALPVGDEGGNTGIPTNHFHVRFPN